MRSLPRKGLPTGLAVILAFTSILTFANLPTITRAAPPYDEEFDGPPLHPKWSWIREDATHWSLTARPGYMRIITQQGDMPVWPWAVAAPSNILLQSPPNRDFEFYTKVLFDPGESFQQAGIIIYKNDDQFLKLVRLASDHNQYVDMGSASQSWANFREQVILFSSTTTYLRLKKTVTVYSGYASADGTTWTLVAEWDIPDLLDYKIGITAFNGWPGALEIPADFDYFREGPPPTGRQWMTGGGGVVVGSGNSAKRYTHGFELQGRLGAGPNNFQFNDHAQNGKFHLETVTSVAALDDPAIEPNPPGALFDTLKVTGTGRWNGVSGYTIDLVVTDAGEPGRNDYLSVKISLASTVVSSVAYKLTSGNHQAHQE